jgi:2-polyprenyl-3-methyl-5-hydroxy-6-metoxy-1,4-benzoquinol methylase
MHERIETLKATPDPIVSLAAMYSGKGDGYFEYERQEMLEFFPPTARSALDVGCGGGAFGYSLKKKFGCEVWGVESQPEAAEKASSRLDHVVNGYFGEEVGLPVGYFDCIFFNDVLEHMVNPWAALEFARQLLSETGVVVASIPNIRHFPALWKLVVRKEWRYVDEGILDRTHIRFFTRQTIEELFRDTGYRISLLTGINPFFGMSGGGGHWRYFKLLNLLTLGQVSDMKYLQYAVRAERAH